MVSAGSPHWLLSPGRDILFIFIFNSSNEWWRWPRQSGRAHKDKSLFHTAASIYWCCPQHDGSLANASFWWHWGCFWFFYLGNASGENCQIVSVHFSLFECLFLCQLFLVFAFFERWRRSCLFWWAPLAPAVSDRGESVSPLFAQTPITENGRALETKIGLTWRSERVVLIGQGV